MLCISRCTDETYAQHFGNGRNKFYLEFRCNRACSNNEKYCSKCINKSPLNKLQQSRKFNHGDINEPIPDSSHIFGGKWYNDHVKKWGAPPSEIIEFAIKYSSKARQGFITIEIANEIIPSLPVSALSVSALPVSALPVSALPVPTIKSKKPKVSQPVLEQVTEVITVVSKKGKKPKVASESSITITDHSEPKKQVRKKPTVTPYSTLVSTTPHLVHKEVSLPTHIESKMEEVDSSGYSIQYIKLTVFDANGTSYFRDAIKNKLYKKVKEKIGVYVGRWNPDTDSIIADIPDSDEE
jgi:hypothetical protein